MNFTIEDTLYNYSGIYSITTTIDNRFYIGSTVNFWRRYQDHRTKFRNGNHANGYMKAFVNKYGLDKFSFNLLYICKSTCLKYNEKLWIETLKPQFNIKKIIERPYFEDEKAFNWEKMRKQFEDIDEKLKAG
jgi:group I intron endonuclease